jgi:hypothetical protein
VFSENLPMALISIEGVKNAAAIAWEAAGRAVIQSKIRK